MVRRAFQKVPIYLHNISLAKKNCYAVILYRTINSLSYELFHIPTARISRTTLIISQSFHGFWKKLPYQTYHLNFFLTWG